MNMLPSILEACEYRMQTTKLLNSYITEMAENSVSERLNFKIFWGSMPPEPPTGKHWKLDSNLQILTVSRYFTDSEVIFKTGWKHWQMNHEYRMRFWNESRIIEVKQDRNHEYPQSNDSASTPESMAFFAALLPTRVTLPSLSSGITEKSVPVISQPQNSLYNKVLYSITHKTHILSD